MRCKHDTKTADLPLTQPTTPARRGRPPVKDRAPDGMPARVRILWTGNTVGERCELFSSEAAALRMLAAWARCGVVPERMSIERKTPAGWVAA